MSDLIRTAPAPVLPTPERVALADDAPTIEELFVFAREAELRVQSLRLTIVEHSVTARGDEVTRHEVQLRHPGQARVTTFRDDSALANDYDVWLTEGLNARVYKAASNVTSARPLPKGVVGADAPDLPLFARQRGSLTPLPGGTLADTFVHPHGLFRNVLVTGPLAIIGSQMVGGREAIIVRAEHPRSAKVLVDRPDRSIEVGIDRTTGFLLLLSERIAGDVTHHAEVTALEIDPVIHDSAFKLMLPEDARELY